MPAMWMKVFGHLHITPRGGSQPWKPMLWNSQRAIFILMLMPEEVWNCNYQASRVLLTFENVRVNGCLFLCGSPMTEGKWSRVYPASHPVIAGIGSSLPATLMDEGQMLGRRLPHWENGSVWDLCPEDSSPRNSWYTAQDSQDPRLSGENPSLKDKDHLQGEWGILLYAHVEMSFFCPLWQINGLLVIIIFFT